jgi:hypothetical protein
MRRIGQGLSLARSSWDLVRQDRQLLLLPLLSALASVLALVVILGPAALVASDGSDAVLYPAFAIELYALTFIATYFGVAFSAVLNLRLDGRRDVSPRDGLAVANARLGAIGWWTFIAGTVGIVIRAIRSLPWVGDFADVLISSVLGFVWGAMTFFVVPVLALERQGARGSIERSAAIVRERWGETAVGFASISAAFVIVLAPLILVVAFVALAFAHSAPALVVAVVVAAFVAALVLMLVQTTLQQTFRVVLFRYASDGLVPPSFDPDELEGAARPRRGLFRR